MSRDKKIYAADLETTVYAGQTCTEAWSAACAELYDEAETLRQLIAGIQTPVIGMWVPQVWNESSGLRRTLQYNLPKCSICGFSAYHVYRYCPNCGARMEGVYDGSN